MVGTNNFMRRRQELINRHGWTVTAMYPPTTPGNPPLHTPSASPPTDGPSSSLAGPDPGIARALLNGVARTVASAAGGRTMDVELAPTRTTCEHSHAVVAFATANPDAPLVLTDEANPACASSCCPRLRAARRRKQNGGT